MHFHIQSSLFGSSKAGRFGNQFFQLLFFHILSEKLNCSIKLPAWKDQLIFENHYFQEPIPTDIIYNLEFVYSRVDGPEATINLLYPLFTLYPEKLDIICSFQFHTNTLYKFRNLLDSKFIYNNLTNNIKLQLNELRSHSNLICIHWREGDYNDFNNEHPYFWKANATKLLIQVKNLLSIFGLNSKIYVASDNCQNIINFLNLEGIEVISSSNFTNNLSHQFLYDFMALVSSDLLITSNSSLSLAAALLNKNAKLFLRTNSPHGDFFTFDPWNTEILINQFKDSY